MPAFPYRQIENLNPPEDLPLLGPVDGVRLRHYSSNLSNMLYSLMGLALPNSVRECIPTPLMHSRDGIRPISLGQSEYERILTVNSYLNRYSGQSDAQEIKEVKEEKDTCLICLEPRGGDAGSLFKQCTNCDCLSHRRCWDQLIRAAAQGQAGQDAFDPQVNLPVAARCPNCRQNTQMDRPIRLHLVPGTLKVAKALKVHLYEPRDWKTAVKFDLLDGEELVLHPWIAFLLRTPKQRVGNHDLWLVTAKLGTQYMPFTLPTMRVDDEVLNAYGPIFHVKRGNGPSWPLTWEDQSLVERVGYSVIRHLFGSSDFNTDWCVNQMMSLVGKEIPQWEGLESDCRRFLESETAMNYHETCLLSMVKKKDVAERQKWVKQQMNGQLSSSQIEWYYWFFSQLGWIKLFLLVNVVILIPMFILSLEQYPRSVTIWSLFLLVLIYLFRLARFCGYLFKEDMPRLKVLNSLKIWKTCSFGVPTPVMSAKAKLKVPQSADIACSKCAAMEVYGCVISLFPVVIPMGCVHDIINGLKIRFLFDREVEDAYSHQFFFFSQKFLSDMAWPKWTWYSPVEWLHHLKPSRKATLLSEDNGSGVDESNWSSDIFCKAEAYVGKTWDKFKPRIIQCRSSSLQVLIGPFFYALYKWVALAFSSGKHVYSVNLNALELGQRAFLSFGKGIVLEGDGANWDGSITRFMLLLELWFLSNIVPYLPSWFPEIKLLWTKVSGASKGVRFLVDWGRRSGDMWTSTFNTLLNILITAFIWQTALLEGTYNGDDNWFVIEHGCLELERQLANYSRLGLTMELVVRHNWRDLEFCSGKFYMTYRGPKWGLKPFRQLAKFGINFGRHSKRKFRGLLYGNALSMLPIAGHVPIFGVFLRRIVETANRKNVLLVEAKREEWQITDTEIDDIHPEEVEHFKFRYGFTDAEYQKLENWASQIDIDDFPMSLDDELFLRGAMADCGGVLPRTDHKEKASWLESEPRSLAKDELFEKAWPLVEEVFCVFCPWYVLALFEFCCGSYAAPLGHGLLHLIRVRFGFWPGVCFHYFVNYLPGHFSLNLLSCLQQARMVSRDPRRFKTIPVGRGTGAMREPELFNSILDCVGSLINRLTKFVKLGEWIGRSSSGNQIHANKNNKNKVQGKLKPKRARGKTNPKQSRGDGKVLSVARMLSDPCNSNLVDGIYGASEGILSRYKTERSFTEVVTNGYVLWCPAYPHTGNTSQLTQNCLMFANGAANVAIQNVGANPFGTATIISGTAPFVGASSFINTASCQDFRTVSACLKATYTGTTSNCAGRIALITNMPVSNLFDLPSVEQVMAFAKETRRTSMETMEVIFRPSDVSTVFRDETAQLVSFTGANPATLSAEAKVDEPTYIGFAFTGVPANTLLFEFIQGIEWRPKMASGYIEPPLKQESDIPYYKSALTWLDRNAPGWNVAAQKVGSSVMGNIANYVLGGAPQRSIGLPARLRIMN